MKRRWWSCWLLLLIATSLVACQRAATQPQAPTPTPQSSATPTPRLSPTPTPLPSPTPTPVPTSTPAVSTAEPPSPVPPVPEGLPPLALPYTPTGDAATGRIRGRLFFPSEYVPSLAVYAVATDGSRFYRADTQSVPPAEPDYEIWLVEPGTYYVYSYPTWGETPFGGAYSYLAACEAGHVPPPPEGCWENPQHDLAPVEVRAGQAVEEVDILDWYGPALPLPPDETNAWPLYTNDPLAYHIRYPPHWQVRSEQELETTFGPSLPTDEGLDEGKTGFASVRVTNGDPEELADELINSLPPGKVLAREWLTFAGHDSLYLALDLPEGRFAWWFVRRYELVYILHAVTDSGLGSFDQMLETFTFEE